VLKLSDSDKGFLDIYYSANKLRIEYLRHEAADALVHACLRGLCLNLCLFKPLLIEAACVRNTILSQQSMMKAQRLKSLMGGVWLALSTSEDLIASNATRMTLRAQQ